MTDRIDDERVEEDLRNLRRIATDVPPADAASKARWQAALDAEVRAEEEPTRVVWAPAIPVLLAALVYAAPMGFGAIVWAFVLGATYAVGAGVLFDEAQRGELDPA